MTLTPEERRELLRKADEYEKAAPRMGNQLRGFAQALREFANRTISGPTACEDACGTH